MMVSEGAEAKIYSARIFGEELLVKKREVKSYRIPQLDVSIRKLRTKKEARVMSALLAAGIPVPRIIALGEFTVYMERLDGKLMKDFRFGKQEIRNSGEILARMHGIDIVHGDFTPANIMVDAGEVHVIDFGLSEFSKDAEEKALDILLMKRSITPEMYKEFREGYAKVSKDSKAILNRLAKIESRGRYQTRTLM